jgi:hypothetical protein
MISALPRVVGAVAVVLVWQLAEVEMAPLLQFVGQISFVLEACHGSGLPFLYIGWQSD